MCSEKNFFFLKFPKVSRKYSFVSFFKFVFCPVNFSATDFSLRSLFNLLKLIFFRVLVKHFLFFQKQPHTDILQNIHNIHRITPALESLLNKVAGIWRCFPMNAVKVLRTTSLIRHFWWLLLLSSNPQSAKDRSILILFYIYPDRNYCQILKGIKMSRNISLK